jgi:hypothetical protein
MKTERGLAKVTWAGPNTPLVTFVDSDDALFPTKEELVDLRDVINLFIESYPESFTEKSIKYTDREEF